MRSRQRTALSLSLVQLAGAAALAAVLWDIGRKPEAIARIFDAFERGESTSSSTRSGGLGLGLTISRHVIEAHGGRLTARSPGRDQGSTFTIALPTVSPPIAPAEATPARPDAPLRVLLKSAQFFPRSVFGSGQANPRPF